MKVNYRQYLYNLSDAKKRKRAIEWCMSLLRQDIDGMTDRHFFEFTMEYECLVAYPIAGVGYYSYSDDEERDINNEFKEFQISARKIISDFEKMKDAPGHLLKNTKMKFTVRTNRKGNYSVDETKEHDFEYSYARQIANALNEKKFDDVFRKCANANCGHYFAVLSKHEQQCCSHKCSVLHNNKKSFLKNPTIARKRGNLESHYSVLRKQGHTDKQIKSLLKKYTDQRNYKPEWIPPSIEKLLPTKSEK